MTSGTWILMWSHLTWIGWPQKVSYLTEIMLNPFVHLLELPLCPGSIHTKWEDKYVFEIVNISLKFRIKESLFYILPYLKRFFNRFSNQITVVFKPFWSVILWYSIKKGACVLKNYYQKWWLQTKIDFQILLALRLWVFYCAMQLHMS